MRRKVKHNGRDSLNGLLFEPMGSWRPPTSFPNLSGAKVVGFDIESKDPHLKSRGPGFIRGDASVVGFSVAADNDAWYFPFGHLSGGNLDRDVCVRFLRDLFTRDDRYIVVANGQYELEGLWHLGVDAKGRFVDIQIAEALIDEERDDGYDVGTLSERYLGISKDERLLREAADAYGIDPKSGLWKLHSKYVGPYGEFDARANLAIFGKQLEILKREDLTEIFELECRLMPILWKMRLQGIPVDLERARGLSADLKVKEDQLRDELKELVGYHIDVRSGKDLEILCDKHQIWYPRTDKGNPSFVAKFLEESEHPILQKVQSVRLIESMRGTFVDDWIFSNELNGKIHPQWKQLKSDDGGARTGRMAASNPNPQQVPARNEIAPLIRGVFRRPGTPTPPWCKLDYSQQEPRILVHYAYLCGYRGAAEWRQKYHDDPNLRIYGLIAKAASVPDRESKGLTLGRMYGMGIKKMAYKCGCSVEKAEEYLKRLDDAVPFVREIAEDTMRKASQRGWIKTLCGRKRHFNYWEPQDCFDRNNRARELKDAGMAVPPELDTTPVESVELAQAKWPNVDYRRAYTYKALNSLIQGSAADMTKQAIVQGYEQQNRVPYMSLHDELDGPVNDRPDAESWKKLTETCVDMTVPMVAGMHYGDSWK